MVYKILVLFFGLVITALSIEWEGLEWIKPLKWIKSKDYKTKNSILLSSFFLALIFGLLDIKDQNSKEKLKNIQAKADSISLNKKLDSANGQLKVSLKNLNTLQQTDSNIYLALNKTKLYYDDRTKAIRPQYGFKPELLGIFTKPLNKDDNTKSQLPVTTSQPKPQEKPRELSPLTKWYIKHWAAQLQQARTSYDNDSATLHNVSEYHTWRLPSTRKQEISDASKALEVDRVNVKNYTDSLNYWKSHK